MNTNNLPPRDYSPAVKVARNINIVDVRFVDIEAKIAGTQTPKFINIKMDARCTHAEPIEAKPIDAAALPEADRFFSIVLAFTLEGFVEGIEKPFFSIKAQIAALYKILDTSVAEYTKEELEVFALTNGQMNLWPYWREFVHSTSHRFGLPGHIVIPVLRFDLQTPKDIKGKETRSEENVE